MASLLNMSGGSLIKSVSTQQIVGEDLTGTYGFVDDVYIGNNGIEVPYGSWSATDYVDISKYSRVYIDATAYAAYYDENKTYISVYRVVKPANAKYIRYSYTTQLMHNGHIIGLF